MENFKKYCKENSISFFLPISFVLAILPLIVRAKKVTLDSDTSACFGYTTTYDLFSQNKAMFLWIASAFLIIFSIIYFKKIYNKQDKITNIILIFSGIFIILTFLSTMFSPYRQVALFGVYNRAEGFLTIFCYFILFIYSIYTFRSTKDYKYIITPLLVVVFINAFLGIFQYAGSDLIQTSLGKLITIPSSISQETNGGSFNLLYSTGKLYGTLFHYNYVGSFAAIVIPILFCCMLREFDITYKITLGCGVIASIWLLFGSTSRAGLIGIFAAILAACIIFDKILLKNKKGISIAVISILIILGILNLSTGGSVFNKIPALFKDAFSVFNNTSNINYKDYIPVKDITHENGTVKIKLKNDTLNISFTDDKYRFSNSQNIEIKPVKYKNSNTDSNTDKIPVYGFTNTNFTNLKFSLYKSSSQSTILDILQINIDDPVGNATFLFKVKSDNSIHLTNPSTLTDMDIEEPAKCGFAGKEKLGSSRGYIWSRSIPLLKNNLILGKGPDTFVLQFPQNELLAKYYAYGNPNTLVDKPHNLYLQIALNNGVIALLAFLGIMIVYLTDSFRLYSFKNDYDDSQLLGTAISLGILAYLFAGIFNDSLVSVSPVFWIILGTGIATNYRNRKELNK